MVSLPPEPPGEPHTQQSCLPPQEKLKQTVCLNTQLFDSVHIQNFLVPHFQIHQKIKASCPSWPRDPKSLLRKGKVSVLPNLLSTYHTRAPTYLSGIIYVVNHFLDLIRREQWSLYSSTSHHQKSFFSKDRSGNDQWQTLHKNLITTIWPSERLRYTECLMFQTYDGLSLKINNARRYT